MSSPPNSRENSLHAIDVPDREDIRKSPDTSYAWIQILASGFQVIILSEAEKVENIVLQPVIVE